MANHPAPDDSSHYEISLTAGQAFIAFILLLCSLGAAFAFGILVGRGNLDERLVVRRDPAVVSEGAVPEDADGSRIVELGVDPDRSPGAGRPPHPSVAAPQDVTLDEFVAPAPARTPVPIIERAPTPRVETPPVPAPSGPVLAQVLSSSEARAAENLAAKLIESGFPTAFVERVDTPQGMIHRVRVRFASEAAAKAATNRLKELSGGGEVWITRP